MRKPQSGIRPGWGFLLANVQCVILNVQLNNQLRS
jgi:hypothetical protein